MSALDDYFARVIPDVDAWAAQFAATPVVGRPSIVPASDPLIPLKLAATKLAGTIEVSNELLMDYGVIPDTRPQRPPLPWRMRLRSRVKTLIWDTRHKAARLAYRVIAGDWPDDGEDW